MPKKFQGENSKAVVARARKEEQKRAVAEEKQKRLEDEYWKDDDKHVKRKQQRKEDREKKQHDQLEKKKEREKLLEEEMQSIKSSSSKPAPAPKVTRAEIEKHKEKVSQVQAAEAAKKKDHKLVSDYEEQPLEENVNVIAGEGDSARNVDDAISMLSVKDSPSDRHPERRLKAAFASYEERRMPSLKAENPGMRLQQLKQLLWKEWQKSPENPLNQKQVDYNFKPGTGEGKE